MLLPLEAVARLGLDGGPSGAPTSGAPPSGAPPSGSPRRPGLPPAAGEAADAPAPWERGELYPWERGELLRRAGGCEVSLLPSSGVAQQQYGGAPGTSARTLSAAVAAIEAAATGGAAAAAGGAADADPLYAVATRPFASQPVRSAQEGRRRECWAELDRAMVLQGLGESAQVLLPAASH